MTSRDVAHDVVVVGGGLIGLLTATELAERGARVLVLEKDDVGFEQSGRSVAAVNLPGGDPNGGPESMLRACADAWGTFEERWGCRIDLNAEGWHIVVADDQDEEWMEIDRQTWNETAGYPGSETLDAGTARERFPSLQGPFRLLEVRHGGHVDATLVMRGLADAARRLGIEIRTGTLVTGFATRGDHVAALRTRAGRVGCGAVIVAAGVWSPFLCDLLGLHVPMQRVRAPALETEPLPAGTIPGFVRGSTFGARQNTNGTVRVTGGYRYSAMLHDVSLNDLRDLTLWAPALWKNRKDVSLRVSPKTLGAELSSAFAGLRAGKGQTVVPQGYDVTSRPRDRIKQLRDLGRVIPAVNAARVRRTFAGVIDLLPDLQPVIGRIPGTDNAFVSTGFSGHGYMYGPGACRAMAELVVGGETAIDLEPYRPERLTEKLSMRSQIF
jgi:glycine/D-amino acid oxidase-like deaminating enzyme